MTTPNTNTPPGSHLTIRCRAAATVPYKNILDFQGDLKQLSEEDYARLRKEILDNGFNSPIHVWEDGNKLFNLDGHQRVQVLMGLENEGFKIPDIPVDFIEARDLKQAKHILLSRVSQYGKPTARGMFDFLKEAQISISQAQESFSIPGVDLSDISVDFFTDPDSEKGNAGADSDLLQNPPTLFDRFGVPPFSILDARQGYWQERKRQWIAMGIKSEVGRGNKNAGDTDQHVNGVLFQSDGGNDPHYYAKKQAVEKKLGHEITTAEFQEKYYEGPDHYASGASIFDPVICELIYRWFSGPGARILDPFAGGSVRGIVAGKLGRSYVGVDLNGDQLRENEIQADDIFGSSQPEPDPVTDPDAMTPVEERGGIWIKRDDLLEVAGVRGGKVRTCWHLAKQKKTEGLVTAGSISSPQVNIVAHIAANLGIKSRLHIPQSNEISEEVQEAEDAGGELIRHKAGRNNVIIARAREDAKALKWTEIPFGMECEMAVTMTRRQVQNFPWDKIKRLVVPVGSAMSLSGILWGMKDKKITTPILGVIVGADPVKRLNKYAPKDWKDHVTLVKSEDGYDESGQTQWRGITIDPHYEAKCLPYLETGDGFWIVGCRNTVAKPVSARWTVSAKWLSKKHDCTVSGIKKRCSGGCCYGPSYWPGKSSQTEDNACPKLGESGCEFDPTERPITCLLYPLILNPNNKIILHHRTQFKTSCCKGNSGKGPMIIEALEGNLSELFGKDQYARVLKDVKAGRDSYFDVPDHVLHAYRQEKRLEEENVPPEARSKEVPQGPEEIQPVWKQGDSRTIPRMIKEKDFDLLFSCPPYADLEVYSDDPADLSNMDYEQFQVAYEKIIAGACKKLRQDSFACFVVGEIRDKKGIYRNLVGDTVSAFQKAGMKYYNEIILVTQIGSLAVRAGRIFDAARKIGKTHQNILVFVKGDPKKATLRCGKVEAVSLPQVEALP